MKHGFRRLLVVSLFPLSFSFNLWLFNEEKYMWILAFLFQIIELLILYVLAICGLIVIWTIAWVYEGFKK